MENPPAYQRAVGRALMEGPLLPPPPALRALRPAGVHAGGVVCLQHMHHCGAIRLKSRSTQFHLIGQQCMKCSRLRLRRSRPLVRRHCAPPGGRAKQHWEAIPAGHRHLHAHLLPRGSPIGSG